MGESDLQAVNSKSNGKCGENSETEIPETATTTDLLKSLVHSFLKRGEVHEALDAYISAYSSDFLDSTCLEVFVDGLAEKAREHLSKNVEFNVVYFVCTMCHDVMTDPVTLKCGHTFSKKCVVSGVKSEPFQCKECGKSYSRSYLSQLKTNVTISCLIDKFSKTQNVESKKTTQAATPLKKWDPGLRLCSNILKKILPSTDSYSVSLMTYLKNGDVLVNLEKYEEALKLYIICYTFDPNAVQAKEKAIKLLHDVLLKNYSKPYAVNNCRHTLHFKISFKKRKGLSCTNAGSKSTGSNYSKPTIDKTSSPGHDESKIESSEGNKLHCMLDDFCNDIEHLTDFVMDRIDTSCLDKRDFECALCMRIFWEPVTTPCGHTFCRVCLNRWFDHQPSCPLCKASLSNLLAERVQRVTEFLEQAIKIYLPEDYAERKAIHTEEMEELCNAGKDPEHVIPLFVCTIAYPTVPCPLHVFEPRYRLMIRQCMESGSCQFGMCPFIDNNIAEYGTMLQIRDVQYFPDGRSVVDTVGSKRFRILRRGERDGYSTGAVEFLEDEPPLDDTLEDVKELHNQVYKISQSWFMRLPRETKHRILQHFGPMPEVETNYLSAPNGPSWFWWMLAVLPLEPRSQLMILSMTSLSQRLKTLYRVLLRLDSTIVA